MHCVLIFKSTARTFGIVLFIPVPELLVRSTEFGDGFCHPVMIKLGEGIHHFRHPLLPDKVEAHRVYDVFVMEELFGCLRSPELVKGFTK